MEEGGKTVVEDAEVVGSNPPLDGHFLFGAWNRNTLELGAFCLNLIPPSHPCISAACCAFWSLGPGRGGMYQRMNVPSGEMIARIERNRRGVGKLGVGDEGWTFS
ncbi:hypothetical protein FIBSPDRAFT_963493 [Athelia psychrophila]|uniref:Uncharacterized protein n=1 Tax=Athelia psychrophila TaxID=1759441 RepID=A0A165YXH4_9AGAM|nr:hypothetical protein FIBSPDRAFT_963493 [Fibularhizoctonia sp. CBS 109695]